MSEKLDKIIEELSGLSVLEIAELSKSLEEKWGVSAVSAVVSNSAGTVAPVEEKKEFDVVLESVGDNKIAVIKEVRGITGLGLKDAKDLVESAPKTLKENVPVKDAEEIKKKLEEVGAKVRLA